MKPTGETITVRRACPAVTVPYGEATRLDEGDEVWVLQALGGSITVRCTYGTLYRVDGADADALGMDPIAPAPVAVADGRFDLASVVDALRTVYDPEISLNVVELGLVYRCEEVLRPDGTRLVSIDMTMTAPGCGMGDVLRGDAIRAVQAIPGVDEVDITIVFDPPWSVHRIPMEARLELGLL